MDTTGDLLSPSGLGFDPTSFDSGNAVTDQSANPSNGIDLGSLMGQLIGTAGQAYAYNQQAQASEAVANSQAQYAALQAQSSYPLVSILSTTSGKTWLIIGGGLLALALILRR